MIALIIVATVDALRAAGTCYLVLYFVWTLRVPEAAP
jgi:hypothetical protein